MKLKKMMIKLTSRKFITGVTTIVTGILMLFGFSEAGIQTIVGGALVICGSVGYIISEGMVDAASVKKIVDAVEDVAEGVKNEV